MKIRSITVFCNPGWPLEMGLLSKISAFIQQARQAYEKSGIEVQTTRLATTRFSKLFTPEQGEAVSIFAHKLERWANASGIDYVALGPAIPGTPWSYQVIPEVIGNTQAVFLSGSMTHGGVISLQSVQACAAIIDRLKTLSEDGFANLRFGATANIPPGGPFFPAAYHSGDGVSFALAMEAADLAVHAFSCQPDLETARHALIETVERQAEMLTRIGQSCGEEYAYRFGGIDFTFAPFPLPERSFGKALEVTGVEAVGLHGSLAAAAILTSTLDQANFQRAGFNGLMMPVLEDAVLAASAAQGGLTVKDLLLYAAVCGTGLDTVPLPGDITPLELQAILIDVAALSQRLHKPLIARLMPIPGKQAGDPTDFDFSYFANSRVMAVAARPLKGFLAGQADIPVITHRNAG